MATGDKLVTLDGLKAAHDHVNGEVSDLRNALEMSQIKISPTWTDGKYVAGNNVEIANQYYSIADFDVTNVNGILIFSTYGEATAGWILLDANNVQIERSLFAGSTGIDYNFKRTVNIPQNGTTLRISCATAYKNKQYVMYAVQANKDLQESAFDEKLDVLRNDYCILSEFDNIFCAGDSLTWGAVYTGAGNSDFRAAKKSYNTVLQIKTGVTTGRNAQPGIDAKNYVSKLSSIIEKPNQLVIVYLGTNGGLTDTLNTDAPGMDKTQYDLTTQTGSYAYIVKHCLDVNAKVLLVKIYAGGGANGVATTNSVIGKVAEKFGVAVIENESLPQKYHIWPNGQGYDYTHLNDFGYAAFAEYLIRQVNAMDATMLARLLPSE